MHEPTPEQIHTVEVACHKWAAAQRERLHTQARREVLPLTSASQATIEQAGVAAAAAVRVAGEATGEFATALKAAGVTP